MNTPSFSRRLRAGESKESLMKHFALTEEQYNRVVACVERIQKEDANKKKVMR